MEEAQLKLYDMIMSISKPMALKAIVSMGIPDIIATYGDGNKSLSVQQIASHISPAPANLESLFRILRFVASHGIFSESPHASGDDITQSRYGLNPVSELLVQKQDRLHSWAPYVLFVTDKVFAHPWHHLGEFVLENCCPFDRQHGMTPWEVTAKDTKSNTVLNEAMASISNVVMPYVVETYQGFKDINTLVDVAGGNGSCLEAILGKHPHIRGINFDLPHVVATNTPIPGVEQVGGNMFESIPSADAIFLKWVLHDWDDERAGKLLKKCFEAIPRNGKVIIVEEILENQGSLRSLQLYSDMAMIITLSLNGAKERTEEEFKRVFEESGFMKYTIIKLPFLLSIIELSKS
uniref:O-methyltransferase domain-containing protein n=1 Tax=Araucaria cunninghamii TaxID=56994 RepID=A0A0D6R916_ARACU